MKNITKGLGIGLLALLAGCATPRQEQKVLSSVVNGAVELTPQEKMTDRYGLQFASAYESAKQSYGSYLRNKNTANAVDMAIAERSLIDYERHVEEMDECVQALEKAGVDISHLQKQMSTLPYK